MPKRGKSTKKRGKEGSAAPRSSTALLAEYRDKRSADTTPEPFSAGRTARPGLFVVHKHAARQLHYDVRLEMDGVLRSWAVPKGPSLNPDDKRLAMHVEDHPLEYGDFEGIIPEGNYGAGAVIVWDRGLWVPIDDPKHGMDKGKLLFDLKGYKLRGRWTLFKIKRGEKEWLMVKKPDAYADTDGSKAPGEASVLSNLTLEDLKEGRDPAEKIRQDLRRRKAPKQPVDPASLPLMLAKIRETPFTDRKWVFELKYDGYRLIAASREGEPFLRYRRGQEVTALFPELATSLAALPYSRLVMDGEVVVLDEEGKPSFSRLQQRVHLKRRRDIERASVRLPATLFVFDLLGFEDFDLRPLPLLARKQALERLLPRAGPLRYSEHIDEQGEAMYEQVQQMRLEGIIAKKADAPYRAGRGGEWLKIRVDQTDDFVVVGYSRPKGSRTGFGALHLATHGDDGLTYAGRVGTGFGAKQIEEILAQLAGSERRRPAFKGPAPRGAEHVWVEPLMVCEVRYKEWTTAGHLRHPAFLRLRDDKPPEECHRPEPGSREGDEPPAPPDEFLDETPAFTNLDKVFWPEEGYTKGDLIEFYRAASPWLLPYLQDRPLVLTRYPDGIEGKNFFQKDAPQFVPDWIRIEKMWSEHAEREIRYFICDDERTLLYLANMGTIPLHVWSSRVATLQNPDWCILDLDPKTAPFAHVVRLARVIHSLCDDIGLPSFPKTSGASGLHVLIPLGRQCTYQQSRMLAQLLSRIVAAEHGKIATTARSMSARKGRVYLDALQNGHGRLLVSPFSVRPLPQAPVSTPLKWTEVNARLRVDKFTIRSLPRRLKRLAADPLAGVLEVTPDLEAALALLGERLDRDGA